MEEGHKHIRIFFLIGCLIIGVIYSLFVFVFTKQQTANQKIEPDAPPVFVRMKRTYLDTLMDKSIELSGYTVVPTDSDAFSFIKRYPSATLRSLLTKPPVSPGNNPLKPFFWRTSHPDTLQITMQAYKRGMEVDVPSDLLYVLIK